MDWVAVGSVATVALVIVTAIQIRNLKSSTQSQSGAIQTTPEMNYRFITGTGKIDLGKDWMVHFTDDKYERQKEISDIFSYFTFGHVIIHNINNFVIKNIELELNASEILHFGVESTDDLAKSAVVLQYTDPNLFIKIAEMPAKEQVIISIMAGRSFGYSFNSMNASVRLKRIYKFDG